MASSVVLLLFGLLSSTTSLPSPQTSFPLNSADRQLLHFSLPSVHNTTALLLNNDSSTLYVGARDTILSLDISQSGVITLKKKVEWSPSEREINDCQDKGKNPTVDCPNFIHVLQQINSTHLYACGSYAYSPREAYIDIDTFSIVQHYRARNRCPFSPFQRNTAIIIDGELFTATTTDFKGVEPQISRHFSKDGRKDVSLDSSVTLLEEPTFVSSSLDPAERKLYFFFSEVGKEFSFVNKLRIARVAQVCKDDVGGQWTLQKKWTSFAKASLLCQSRKQLPFNILQDMFALRPPEESTTLDTLFYGVFTSQWSLRPESAVCVFNLQDFRTVFTGSYRTFNMQTHQWNPLQGKHSYLGQCGLEKNSNGLAVAKGSFLTSDSVKPVGDGPIVVSTEHSYNRMAVMRTQAANGKVYEVLFLLTESGFLHKVVLFDQGAQVIEEIQVFRQPQLVKSIVLSSSKRVLYVGTLDGVTAVPVAKCSIYRTCTQCVQARDPFCGWSLTRRICTILDSSPDNMAQLLENGNVEEECDEQIETSVNKGNLGNVPDTIKDSETEVTEEPVTSALPPLGDPEDYPIKNQGGEFIDIEDKAKTNKEEHGNSLGSTPTSRSDVHSRNELPDTSKVKSYYSELVVVSLMLAVCICILILTGLRMFCQRKKKKTPKVDGLVSQEDGSKIKTSMERVFPL
ncbi:hypothetical protein PAMP_002471 [Pampus punctatissimus]